MLSYARQTTLGAVEGLTSAQLDHLHDERSNSIGALLAHVAAVERGFQLVTFEEREPTAAEHDAWSPALTLGDRGAVRSVVTSCSSMSTSFGEYARRPSQCWLGAMTRGSRRRSESHPL